ncbi:unnamed protein product, partial [Heterosigma akashiwo]
LPHHLNLSYAEVGDLNGFPMLAFLGVDSHRYAAILLEDLALEHKIRLICIDRP